MDVSARESDFGQLQREYRHLELNRKAYTEESAQVLRKQQTSIEKLRRDNEALKTELAMEMRQHSGGAASATATSLSKLHDDGDKYAQQIEAEKRGSAVLVEQIALMRSKVLHQRKVMGGVNAARENQAMVQKQIRILENRLDKALVKFNEALAQNKTLRQTIDSLRRERVVFDNIYRKLERELHEKKRQMANIIELSNLSYEQRDNYQMEIAAIEQQNRKEQEDFEEQMMELGRMLENELKISAPTAGASGRLSPLKRNASSRTGVGATGGAPEMSGNMTSAEEAALTGKVNKGAWGIAKDKAEVHVSQERVQNFEEAFNKIRTATGIADVDELVHTFIKNEDQNFSLFNYVNEQTNEIEKQEEQIQALQEEEKKYAQESGDDVNQHKQVLRELEAKLQGTENQVERLETKSSEGQRVVDALKKGIGSIFARLECSEAGSEAGGGGGSVADGNVSEGNMLQYLGIVEQRVNDLMQQYAMVKAADAHAGGGMEGGDASGALTVLGTGPSMPMGQDLVRVNPPRIDEFESDDEDALDDDDDDARPMTRDELKARTLNRMHRGKHKGKHQRKK